MQSFPGRTRSFHQVPHKNYIPRGGSKRHATWSQRQQLEHAARLKTEQALVEAAIAECERRNREICNRAIVI